MTIGESRFLNHVRFPTHHRPMASSSSNSTPRHEKMAYFVREPLGKRAAQNDEFENGPKAKRRFERINSMLGDFSISRDDPFTVASSSDEDMEEPPCDPTPGAIVEEPDDPAPSGIQLDYRLKGFLDRAKQSQQLLPPSMNAIRGDELIVWRPLKSMDPFDDPQMHGRIQEVSDEEGDGEEENPGSVEVSTPTMTDEEMSVDSERGSVPLIRELSDDDSRGSPLSTDDSMDMD